MPLITLKDGSLAYGHWALLDHAELQLDPRERVALIGRNGSGKTTLLRVLAGDAALDAGELWRAPDARIALVPQEPAFAPEQNVYATVAEGLGAASRSLADYHATAEALAHAADAAAIATLSEALAHKQAELERIGAWSLENRIRSVSTELGLDGEAPVAALSGGWKKRVALARALVAAPNVLLLDEPTNHLDIDGIAWLENLLRDFDGALVCITHDRRFLDAIATRVVELDRGVLRSYPGSFARYREQKQQQLEHEATVAAKADKFLAEEEVWIRKGVEARRTRNAGRVARLEKLRALRAQRRERLGRVELKLDRGEAGGKLVAELNDVSKGYGGRTLIERFTTRLIRGDKVGLIGPNGCGKTTLLRLILGQEEPDRGSVRRGTGLQVAYFDQMREALDPEATLADTISPGSDTIEIGGTKKHIMSYLDDFLFEPARARSPVKTLSGGERNRLLLARLFARPANVLVLDEPTNDLDIDTLELLEELLQEYPGTVFLVSHDRAFLDNVVTQVIAFEGGGVLREYPGGYSDWEDAQERMRALREAGAGARKPAATPPPARARSAAPEATASSASAKLSFRERQELEALPARIEALESTVAALQQQLADPALYQRDADAAREAARKLRESEDAVAGAYARWEALEARRQP